MARKDVLKRLESEFDDLEKIIPPLVNEGGQKHAATKLNTTQSTISKWLKDNGYKPETKWVKQTGRNCAK